MARCPQCGDSYYVENYCTTTSMYYPPVIKDGKNLNPDGNITTHYCTCQSCGNNFVFSTRYGELYRES